VILQVCQHCLHSVRVPRARWCLPAGRVRRASLFTRHDGHGSWCRPRKRKQQPPVSASGTPGGAVAVAAETACWAAVHWASVCPRDQIAAARGGVVVVELQLL
jgi:hypothetical protein